MGKTLETTLSQGLFIFICWVGLLCLFALLLVYPTMYLWNNCLVDAVTFIKPISSFWQMFGIIILCGILFKSSNSNSKD